MHLQTLVIETLYFLTPSTEKFYFLVIITGMLAALSACFVLAVSIMSIGEWLQGGSFKETFTHCWKSEF